MNSLDQYVPNMLLVKSEEIAPEGMRSLARRNNTQLWMCLVMKVKSDTVKIILVHGPSESLSNGLH